ncbi:HEAT repeat domain-containing protein [Methylomarinum vadi]|uniref:HEAT repeat domain-containing protein n=1 Tax=Methylomarinum vadi TaxID=438855 RepID=UPI001363F31F|nr:HEAT repeat domain-containing protein [Methylomarinum vadi]
MLNKRICLIFLVLLNACESGNDESTNKNNENKPVPAEKNTVVVPKMSTSTGLEENNADDLMQFSNSDLSFTERQVDELEAIRIDGREGGVVALLDALHSDMSEVRLEAVLGLQEYVENPEVVLSLMDVLDDPDNNVVVEAIDVLEAADDPRAIGKLEEIAEFHPDSMIRELARNLVDKLEASP